jgi:hypothetical protein
MLIGGEDVRMKVLTGAGNGNRFSGTAATDTASASVKRKQ